MLSRPRALLTALAVTVGFALAGCAPTPAPTFTHAASATTAPRPTTADEAFAAAERTYRAYVDALNHVDLSDPKTFEAVYAWTTGEALEGEKKSLSTMHAKGWRVSGSTRVALVRAYMASPDLTRLALDVCQDVSTVRLEDSRGQDQVDADRVDIQAMRVTLVRAANSASGFLIGNFDGRSGGPSCG